MNETTTIQITGTPIITSYSAVPYGWSLIGFPSVGVVPFSNTAISNYFNTSNSQTIKNFEGFWEANGSLNSIINFEPGKGYYIFK